MAAGSRRRRATAGAGALVLAAVIGWWLWPAPAADASPVAPPPAMPGPTLPAHAISQPVAPPAPPPPRIGPERPTAPVIDEILVEKREVCEGEENLITVRAHTVDGTDPYLHYLVGSSPGQKVPVRSWLDDDADDAPPSLQVKVFGKNNVATVAEVPPFVVKPCRQPYRVAVVPRLRANTWSEFDFEARIEHSGEGAPLRPRKYVWHFGDGESASTTVPRVTHSYEDRPQNTQYAQLLVSVVVHGEDGVQVTGRTSLQLMNPAFEDLATKGVVTLFTQLTPRFPELGRDGTVRQRVRLFHHRPSPVFIHQAVQFRHRIDATHPSVPDAVSPQGLLGSTMIPPGRGIELEVALDTRAEPDLFSVEYVVEGKDAEGRPARGAFSVMRPPERPTAANSVPVGDPLKKAKILAARELLGRPYVTDEDLFRLEREGKLAHLEVAAATEPEAPEVPGPAELTPPPDEGPRAPDGAEQGGGAIGR